MLVTAKVFQTSRRAEWSAFARGGDSDARRAVIVGVPATAGTTASRLGKLMCLRSTVDVAAGDGGSNMTFGANASARWQWTVHAAGAGRPRPATAVRCPRPEAIKALAVDASSAAVSGFAASLALRGEGLREVTAEHGVPVDTHETAPVGDSDGRDWRRPPRWPSSAKELSRMTPPHWHTQPWGSWPSSFCVDSSSLKRSIPSST
mmetsp:Transcript_107135/g.301530  ORF Transcript_107135/g.301530 Transcript_107135/m.301530 type:complete len:205 (-) Transcript_107135:636-1250(-)